MNLFLARLALILSVLLSLLVIPVIGVDSVLTGEWASVALMGAALGTAYITMVWAVSELLRRPS